MSRASNVNQANDLYETVTIRAVLRRFGAILFGVIYLAFFTHVFALVTEYSKPVCAFALGLAAMAIMIVLTVFGVRAVDHQSGRLRFSISTMLLIVVPMAIYLAATRILIAHGLGDSPLEPALWLVIVVYALLVWSVTTVVLLLLAEAVVWMTARCMRLMKRRAP